MNQALLMKIINRWLVLSLFAWEPADLKDDLRDVPAKGEISTSFPCPSSSLFLLCSASSLADFSASLSFEPTLSTWNLKVLYNHGRMRDATDVQEETHCQLLWLNPLLLFSEKSWRLAVIGWTCSPASKKTWRKKLRTRRRKGTRM